jgi:replication factor C subunit 3/5
VEKYRPKKLEELISQEDIISTCKKIYLFLIQKFNFAFILKVQRFIKQDQLPHLLFYGPPGKFL